MSKNGLGAVALSDGLFNPRTDVPSVHSLLFYPDNLRSKVSELYTVANVQREQLLGHPESRPTVLFSRSKRMSYDDLCIRECLPARCELGHGQ